MHTRKVAVLMAEMLCGTACIAATFRFLATPCCLHRENVNVTSLELLVL